MPATMIEKILAAHSGRPTVAPGEIVDLEVDARVARDFGGANVVKNLVDAGLGIADPKRTHFTFDCNPTGSDQRYAANQQRCRLFAADHGMSVYDIDSGIGTHVAIEEGLVWPGSTLVSTDSHANIVGAVGAFGQGMGDADIAGAFAHGRVWFKVPPTVRVVFSGKPGPEATAKDLVLAAAAQLGAKGLLGCAAELSGEAIEELSLAGRVTVSSMATEMGAIIALIPPDERVVAFCREHARETFEPVYADPKASYVREEVIDVTGLAPLVARPGHPDDVVPLSDLPPTRVHSAFIGSCTNGRLEDLRAAVAVLRGRRVAPGVVLKVVPATDRVWRACLEEGLLAELKQAGALVSNAGCAGCAAGQVGQNGPGEVTVSTGNRNFPGKQGQGEVYLASPATAAASAVAGALVTAAQLEAGRIPEIVPPPRRTRPTVQIQSLTPADEPPTTFTGRAWCVDRDSIDTDMIYHNRHLAETDPAKMGQHAFGNLPGWEDFPSRVRPGDVIFTGANFGCGSSRQQAVTCFTTLGVRVLVARSFGAIYERNAVNEAMPVLVADWSAEQLSDGDEVWVDLVSGRIENRTTGTVIAAQAMSAVALEIYKRGGLLRPAL